jgi:hypothetical protein
MVAEPVTKLSDSAHVRIGIKRDTIGFQKLRVTLLSPVVARIVEALPSFVCYPIASLVSET